MGIEEVVNVDISTTASGVAQEGFSTILLLGATNAWSELTRTYTSLTDVQVDFAATTPEYLAAQRVFAQSPRPAELKIGRRGTRPATVWTLTPDVQNSTAYSVYINGTLATFTSDASATLAEILTGLAAAITALSPPGITVANTGTVITLTAAAGAWVRVAPVSIARIAVAVTNPAGSTAVQTDLDSLSAVDDDWYVLINLYPSKEDILGCAAWAESHEKLFIAGTQDTAAATVTFSGSGTVDVVNSLKNLNYTRSAAIWHHDNGSFLDPGWAATVLQDEPGSVTWKFKQPTGVAAYGLSPTHIANLRAKNGNFLYVIGGQASVADGKTASGEWIDIRHGIDHLSARLQEGVYSLILANKKVPYTDAGVASIEAVLRGVLIDRINSGFLSGDPEPVITVPRVVDVDPADRAARHLPDVTWTAQAAGAIHKTTITGTITV